MHADQYSTTLAIILNGTTPLPNLKKCKPQTAISAMQARQSKTVLRDHRTRKLVCIISIDSLRFLFLQTTGMLQEDSRMHAPALFANYFPSPHGRKHTLLPKAITTNLRVICSRHAPAAFHMISCSHCRLLMPRLRALVSGV